MTSFQQHLQKQYLHDISAKDTSWDFNKSASKIVERYFREADYQKLSERVKNCASKLTFKMVRDSKENLSLKLQPTFLCHVRLCPICQCQRTRVLRAKLNKAIPLLTQDNPKMRYIFLTLTVKNCKVTDLKNTIQTMSKSFTKLFKLKNIKGINKGYIKSLEITRSAIDECHPHYHVLLAVNPSYFSHYYITQTEWTESWKKSLDVDYNPIVHITTVKHDPKEICDFRSMEKAVAEVAKYMIKPMDLIGKGGKKDRDFYIELGNQIHGLKARNTSGIFRTYLGDFEAKEEEIFEFNDDDHDTEEHDPYDQPLEFYFNQQDKKYVLVDDLPF